LKASKPQDSPLGDPGVFSFPPAQPPNETLRFAAFMLENVQAGHAGSIDRFDGPQRLALAGSISGAKLNRTLQ
jgi:hypothetical protein